MKFLRRSSPEQPPDNASFVPLDEIWPQIEALTDKLQKAEEQFPFPGGTAQWGFDIEGYDVDGSPCMKTVTVGYRADNPLHFKFSVMENGLTSVLDFIEEPDVNKVDHWIFKVYEADVDPVRQGAMLKAGVLSGRGARELPDSPFVIPNKEDAEQLVELFIGYSDELVSRGY